MLEINKVESLDKYWPVFCFIQCIKEESNTTNKTLNKETLFLR